MKCRLNFHIPNCNFNLVAYAPHGFILHIPKKDGRQVLKEWFLQYSDGTIAAYIPTETIKELTEWIKDKIVSEPSWAEELHAETENINREYFAFARELEKKDLSAISNDELADDYDKLRDLQFRGHCTACSTTWFVDSDGEVFSKYLRKELKKHLDRSCAGDGFVLADYFALLTTPTRSNFAQEEQLEFLDKLKQIKNGAEARPLIEDHWRKWRWTPYGYIGPAYDLVYYEKLAEETLRSIEDIDKTIEEEKTRNEKIATEQKQLIEKIKLPQELNRLFAIAREIIWLKDFRKYCIWYGHFVLDKFTKEIAKRVRLTHKQANHFLREEVREVLLRAEADEHLLNERVKYCLMRATEEGTEYFYGQEAKEMMEKIEVEEDTIDLSAGFKGSTACPGKVTGAVKIVNSIEDIKKVEAGDIMLALTTYPAYLPAMKRAAAIVTEDGGITCHAAIVSREFRIPCVVGIRKITKILKDGDRIEVDATNGVIKIIK